MNKKRKGFAGSNTHIFSMIYPWIIVVIGAILLTNGLLPQFTNTTVLITIAVAPVIVSIVWFIVKNKGINGN